MKKYFIITDEVILDKYVDYYDNNFTDYSFFNQLFVDANIEFIAVPEELYEEFIRRLNDYQCK